MFGAAASTSALCGALMIAGAPMRVLVWPLVLAAVLWIATIKHDFPEAL